MQPRRRLLPALLLGPAVARAAMARFAGANADDGFALKLFPAGTSALCLDGSVAGYYVRPGRGAGASTFLLELEGGQSVGRGGGVASPRRARTANALASRPDHTTHCSSLTHLWLRRRMVLKQRRLPLARRDRHWLQQELAADRLPRHGRRQQRALFERLHRQPAVLQCHHGARELLRRR
jgi:hypothetical protein